MALTNVKPSVVNLNPIVIGADAIYVITFPYSLTGYSFEAAIETEVGNNNLADFTIDVDEVNNRVTMSLTDTQTSELTAGLREWYLLQTDAEDLISKTHTGKVRVEMP
jgi:hypothetical protein